MMDFLSANDLVHLNERACRTLSIKFYAPDEATEARLATMVDRLETTGSNQLADKAAGYFHDLLTTTYFASATRATALLAARTFVELNGGSFHKKLKVITSGGADVPAKGVPAQDIWLNLVAEVADGEISPPALEEWFRRNTTIGR